MDDFAFLVNARNFDDIRRVSKIFKIIPGNIVQLVCLFFPPRITSRVIGLKTVNGKKIDGCLIGILMTDEQMLRYRWLARWRMMEACKIAKKNEVGLLGLAVIPSYITKGGFDLVRKHFNKPVVNGRTMTAAVAIEAVKIFLNKNNVRCENAKIAILGATDLVGKGISKWVCRENFKKITLIGKTIDHLSNLKDEITAVNKKNYIIRPVEVTTDINGVNDADMIIIVSTNKKIVINADMVKKGAVIYNVTQSRNGYVELREKRPDVKFIVGSLMETPGIVSSFDFGLPVGVNFSCLTETMVSSAEGAISDSVGDIELVKLDNIINIAKKYNFKPYINY